jgi:hypothetical protein
MTVGPADLERAGEVRAARWLAGVSAFFWAVVFYGLVDLTTVIARTAGFEDTYLLEAGWGLLFTVVLAVPLAALARRPGQPALLLTVAAVAAALGVTAVAALSWGQLVPAGLLAGTVAFLTDLARGSVRPTQGWRLPAADPVLALLALVVAAPAGAYAFTAVRAYHAREAPTDYITRGLDHWPVQAALALAVLLVSGVVAAGVRGRWPGTLVSAVTVSVSVAWLGLLSIWFPDHAASLGRSWGLAAVIWSGAFGAAVALRWRSPRAASASTAPRP